MLTKLRNWTLVLAGAALFSPFAQAAISASQPKTGLTKMEAAVRHELVMLPWFGVFDNLEFKVEGSHVTLFGQVTRPTLKSSAENVVKGLEGVDSVTNEIEVLPLSPMDDRIRLATYRSIFGFGSMSRYAWGPVPPVHIIVKNGNVSLKGIVANETDKNIASIRANSVSGVFSVNNDLRVESSARS